MGVPSICIVRSLSDFSSGNALLGPDVIRLLIPEDLKLLFLECFSLLIGEVLCNVLHLIAVDVPSQEFLPNVGLETLIMYLCGGRR